MTVRAAITAACLLLTVACSASSVSDVDTDSANQTEARTLVAIKGREWARCWFEPAPNNHATLSCTSTARGTDPLGAKVDITALVTGGGGQGSTLTTHRKTLDIEAGGTVVIATIPRASFPVVLLMNAQLSPEARSMIGETSGIDFALNQTLQGPEALLPNQAAVLKQPFDLWPAAFIDGRPDDITRGAEGSFQLEGTEYTRSIAPYAASLSARAEMKLSKSIYGADVKGKITYFVAPAPASASAPDGGSPRAADGGSSSSSSSSIAMTLHTTQSETDVAISGPGYWAIKSDGTIATATPDLIARDFPTSTSTPREAGASPDATTEPTEPIGPSHPPPLDPDPSCGGDGQARCANGACDSGTRWTTLLSPSQCTACGAPGQTYCLSDPNNVDSSSAHKCNSGTRWTTLANPSQCIACGGAGQTYCVTDPNNMDSSTKRKCNPGTRFTTLANPEGCIACGAEGQTYCLADPDNSDNSSAHKCNDGLRIINDKCSR